MPQFLKDYGERLVELGYTALPIKPGTKRPDLTNWPNHATTVADVRAWYSNGRAQHGVGINARNTPAIDVDVMDKAVADAMSDEIDRIFAGQQLMTRTGLAPKFLIPFRSDEPFRKITSNVYTDGNHEHKVEILGDGQQWVAYHLHPDTGKPYSWFDGVDTEGIADKNRDSLPELTSADARRVVDAFEVLAAERVAAGQWRAVTRASDAAPRAAQPDSDPFAAHAEPVKDLTRSQLVELLQKLPLHDRGGWLRAGRVLHHQFEAEEDGFELWVDLSKDSEKFDEVDQRRVWESFGHRPDAPETVRSLIKEFGQPEAVHAPARHHPEGVEGDMVPFTEGSLFAQGFEDVDWLIEDVMPRAQVGVIYGASGSGKTFFSLDLACTVHRGQQWRDKYVVQADTFYVAAEAGAGIRKRIAAYIQQKGEGPLPWFVDYQPNLATLESVHAISQSVKRRSTNAGLIFIDTLALSHDGDENSSKDMSLVLRHCKILADDTGAMVVLVHHTGKDDSKGMRGSSALYAGSDFVLEITAEGKNHAMFVDKLKDGERGTQYGFTLPSVGVGVTPRGKSITSCYVSEAAAMVRRGIKPLIVNAQIFIMDVFKASLGSTTSMSETELVEAVKERQRENDDKPSQTQSIKNSINKMVISGHFCKENDRISSPHSTHSDHLDSFE